MKNILEISAAELHSAYLSTFNTNINRIDPAHLPLRIYAWLEGLKTGASLRGVMPIQNGVKTFNGRLTYILRGLIGADDLSLGNFMALIFKQIPEDFCFVDPEKLPNSHEIKTTMPDGLCHHDCLLLSNGKWKPIEEVHPMSDLHIHFVKQGWIAFKKIEQAIINDNL